MSDAVSCPDWTRLAAHRFEAGLPEPTGWDGALAHLAGCAPCRRRALTADPTLVFRQSGGEAGAAGLGADQAPAAVEADADEMRRAVAAMRRAGRVLPTAAASRRPAAEVLGTVTGGWGRIAAAAVLAASVFAFTSGPPPGIAPAANAVAAPRAAAGASLAGATVATGLDLPAAPAAGLAGLPVFEGIDRPRDAHVYQLDGDGMVVVMIVDETLDV